MEKKIEKNCPSCGKKAHNFEKEQVLDCIPPINVLKFGKYQLNKEYREALFEEYPFYVAEEIVGSFLGKNNLFPSQEDWLSEIEEDVDDEDET